MKPKRKTMQSILRTSENGKADIHVQGPTKSAKSANAYLEKLRKLTATNPNIRYRLTQGRSKHPQGTVAYVRSNLAWARLFGKHGTEVPKGSKRFGRKPAKH